MKTHPLKSLTLQEATDLQFKIIDCIMEEFTGYEILNRGDLGVRQPGNIPLTTSKVEKVIANIFNAESAMLLRGSGTNAIRQTLALLCLKNKTILVHDAPIYPTTEHSLNMINANIIYADFNDVEEVKERILHNPEITSAIVQLTRQKLFDSYDSKSIIEAIKNAKSDIKIITDDNYAVFKTKEIGVEMGADISAFSTFKLLGPEGIGCIVGNKVIISEIKKMNYSGGSQVQGHEALDVLNGFVYAPVSLAIQAKTIDEVNEYINTTGIKGVKECYIANAQSKVLIIKLDNDNALDVLIEAEKLGALPHPVGAESKYEFVPLFYRASGTFRKADPNAINNLIRINPNRAGSKTIIRILKEAISNA
ncbi:aminotransferase [Candidatus Izimaplasma bacterium ZiA1]|uniref:aminotransferase class V-fold PLP-dependent enzyme n=1 Tax=Candidatus Izimoplasma sp. ZiA1 TaxID=2024899 RepID=UPI000BAA7404|nr:aminotransferase [Candidatus Izimaplasma bacterium ZiA1]